MHSVQLQLQSGETSVKSVFQRSGEDFLNAVFWPSKFRMHFLTLARTNRSFSAETLKTAERVFSSCVLVDDSLLVLNKEACVLRVL